MDGYAVRSADLAGLPASLRVVGEVAAGSFPSRALAAGEAMKVMTGAPVPNGSDSVIRREDTDDGTDTVLIRDLRDTRKNIRRKGEDFRAGDILFEKGAVISAAHLGAIASAGIKSLSVHGRPVVALISSGDELIELDDFDSESVGKKIVSSNSLTLASLVRDAGGIPLDLGIAADTPSSLRGKLESAHDAHLIITSAGISVGDHDHVRDVFAELGGQLDFWKVRMRPGAPLAFGMLNGKPWIGLSGNPVSAIVTFELFVRPVIRMMLGFTGLFRQTFPVTIGERITIAAPLMHFLRVIVTQTSEVNRVARLAGSQSSAVLTAMARANALLILPGDRLVIEEGETHRAMPIGNSGELSDKLVLT